MTETASPLMARRIRRILLVCNNYDKFALEEDGRIEPRITAEYSELNLSNPPVFERAESTVEALEMMEKGAQYDLVITMYNVGEVDVFDFSQRVKAIDPDTSVVLLTAFAKEIYKKMESHDLSHFDGIFCWNNHHQTPGRQPECARGYPGERRAVHPPGGGLGPLLLHLSP